MHEEHYKSSKTPQVLGLINSSSTEINPILLRNPEFKETAPEKRSRKKETVEDKLKSYTESKRGGRQKPTKKRNTDEAIRNPILHIPEEEGRPPVQESDEYTQAQNEQGQDIVEIDVNRLILEEQLDGALTRFNTCHCDVCKNKLSELVMSSVPVKIVSAPRKEAQSLINSYREYATKQISDCIVRILVANKRKPFHT